MKSNLKIFLNTLFSRTMSYMMLFYPIWFPGAYPTYELQEPPAAQFDPALYFHCTHSTADPALSLGLG